MDRIKNLTKAEWALEHAKKGFYVFPLAPGLKIPLLDDNWIEIASVDPDQIKKWWDQDPDANIGIACGPSGLCVLDVDMKKGKDGQKSLEALEVEFGCLPKTLEAKTPSGGRHLIFKGKTGNSYGRIGPGLDIKSEGGYIVAPGSETIAV